MRRLRERLGRIVRGPHADLIRHDLEDLYQRDRARGLSQWRAHWRYGRRLIGSVLSVGRERAHALTAPQRSRKWRWPGALAGDLSVGARRLAATPVFTTFAVLSLALGVGVTTAAYSAMYALGGRPSGVRDESRVLLVTATDALRPGTLARMPWADYQDLMTAQRSFADVVAWARVRGVLVGRSSSVRVSVEGVSGRYFSMLGIRPALGRTLVPDDDRPDATAAIVLSDLLWRRQFAADPAIVGTNVRFAEELYQIVGVAPPEFRGARPGLAGDVTAWVALARLPSRTRPADAFDRVRRDPAWLQVAARLRPGVTAEAAARDVATIGHRLNNVAALPIVPERPHQPAFQPVRAWSATPLDDLASPMDAEPVRIALGLPLLVLLIACTNLANLILSRASTRRHETALRGALGASRCRLLQEHLSETIIIAAAGGLLGALVAHGLLTWTVSLLREPLETFTPGLLMAWRLEPVVFVAAGACALLSLLVAGLVPALQAIRVDAGRALTVGDPASAMPRWRWRSNLIAVQVGVSAGLFLITVVCVRFLVIDAGDRIPPGLTSLAVAGVEFEADWPAARVEDTTARIVEEARRLPNVAAAAASTGLPIEARTLLGMRWFVQAGTADASPTPPLKPPTAGMVAATADLPAVMGLDTLSGRFVDATGRGRGVAIDEGLARNVFGTTTAVGRQIRLRQGGTRPDEPLRLDVVRTVVGVVSAAPMSERSLRRGGEHGAIFVPFVERLDWDDRLASILVISARTRSGDATDLAPQLRTVVRRVNQDLFVLGAMRGDRAAGGELVVFAPLVASSFGFLAAMSLALAMAGLYGVLSHVVSSRTREMGIRVALGASRGRLRMLVLRQGLRPVGEGLAIGLGVALVARQLLQMAMTETLSAVNVATFAAAAVPLVAAGYLAAYLPARRASRVDPNVALRDL